MANIFDLVKRSVKEWKRHNPLFMGAAISFYVILSLGPILTLMVSLAGSILTRGMAEGEIVQQLNGVVGDKAAGMIQKIISQVTTGSGRKITLIASVPLIFFGSTMIFFQLKYALDLIFGDKKERKSSLSETIKEYSFSFLMLFILGIVFILLLLKNPILNTFKDNLSDLIPVPWLLFRIMEIIFSFTLLVFIFSMVYKILPDKKMDKKDIAIGALVTALLFTVVQYLVGTNAENTQINNAYGAIGSVTILILWIFYSSLVFLFGASFTKVVSENRK